MNGSIQPPHPAALSREFVCERWGKGEEWVAFYAPVTRENGVLWIHPTWAREYAWEAIRQRAERIWLVSGSFWNPGGFQLIHGCPPGRGGER